MTKKYKWYKDKWGWIGAILYILIFIYFGVKCPTSYQSNIPYSERCDYIVTLPFALFFNYEYGKVGWLSSGGGTNIFLVILFNMIIYFIIGILLHKLFIKLKWVKH